jgi:hypothetical protein
MIRTAPPELIKERIIKIRAELRRLQIELRLAEAERRDRTDRQRTVQSRVSGRG